MAALRNSSPQPASTLAAALAPLGPGPLTQAMLDRHVRPLFSRVLARAARTGEVYLANHSLGRAPDRAAEDVRAAVDAWYADLDGAWSLWLSMRDRFRAHVAGLIGWHAPQTQPDAIVPTTSVAAGLRTVLNSLPARGRPLRIVTTRGEFDSVDHVLKMYAARGRAEVRWVGGDDRGVFHGERIIESCAHGADVVVISRVFFATGQQLGGMGEIRAIVDAAHRVGAVVVLDTYHSVGVLPERLAETDADFAVGGSYKYTRGGPGACWLAIHPRHLRESAWRVSGAGLAPLDTGWFAKASPFAYVRTEEPELAAGGDGWLEATPPVLAYGQALAGLEFTRAMGVDRLRAWSLGQQSHLRELLAERGVRTNDVSSGVADGHTDGLTGRGAFVLVPVRDGASAARALAGLGVNVDARPCPVTGAHHVRLCPDVLTTPEELERGAAAMAEVAREQA